MSLDSTDFESWEQKGLTHIFYSESLILRDYTRCKTYINRILDLTKDTDLIVYPDLHPFKDASLQPVNPDNTTHRDLMITRINQLLTDIPELPGIIFNDLQYPIDFYSDENKATQDTILADWTHNFVDGVKTVHPTKKIGASFACSFATPRSPNITLISEHLDFIMPQLYPNIQLLPRSFITSQISTILENTTTPVYVDLATYKADDDISSRPYIEVEADINEVMKNSNPQIQGYAIYSWPYMDTNLTFFNKYQRHLKRFKTKTTRFFNKKSPKF